MVGNVQEILAYKQTRIRLIVGACISACILLLYIAQPFILRQGDRQIYDIFLRASEGGKAHAALAIVDIDEASLQAYGQWPWPRHLMTRLIRQLTESGAAAIGLDIMLAKPDRTSPVHLQQALKEGFNENIGFTGLPDFLRDNDLLLAEILRQTPTVLGSYVQFETQLYHTPITVAEATRRSAELADFAIAREAYLQSDFTKTLFDFTQLLTQYPESVLYSVYTERSKNLLEDPPQNWDGVWTFTKK